MKEIRMTVVVASSDRLPGEDPGIDRHLPAIACPTRTPRPCRFLTGPDPADVVALARLRRQLHAPGLLQERESGPLSHAA
jgi:hypothetical protein